MCDQLGHVVGKDRCQRQAMSNKTRNKNKNNDAIENGAADDVAKKIADMELNEDTPSKKLTHKEKKKLKKQQEYERTMEMMTKAGGQGHSELESNFTVSQSETQQRGNQQLDHAVDIKVENFSIAAKGKELFTNASLLIAQGRRYGLVGPNGYIIFYCLRYLHTSLGSEDQILKRSLK